MHINADFSKRAVVHAASLAWVPSPIPGVERRMLDRIGEEVARATSIVRYAPGSAFSPHTHDGGEEFLVLDGVFQDEHGDYPVGTYVRNPPTTRHIPRSEVGCTILVKLHQFDLADRTDVRLDTNRMSPVVSKVRPGVLTVPLFSGGREDVRIEYWCAGARIGLNVPGGLEVLVLDGGFTEGQDEFVTHSWLRLPAGAQLDAVTGKSGAKLWIKTGHLT
jgi:anti-sigma factor ChrR (cupin superfamily)